MSDQLLRTLTLLETLLDYLPGPQMIRSPASDDSATPGRSRVYTAAEIDRQLAYLEHQARLRRNDNSKGSEPWEAARREQYRHGDYAALDVAMMELEVVDSLWASLAWRVAHHHPGVMDQALRVELVRSVLWLAQRLPRPARVPAWAMRSAAPSALHIAALREIGVPYSVLARVYGVDAKTARRMRKQAIA